MFLKLPKLNFDWKKILSYLSVVSVFFISAFVTYLFLSNGKAPATNSSESPAYAEKVKDEENFDPEKPFNILLLGYGGEGHEGGSLSDVLMVVHVSPQEKKVVLISIPRDTWVELPVRSDIKEFHKINYAHAIGSDDTKYPLKEPQFKGSIGGGELAKYALEKVTGLPMHFFLSVDFNGFKRIVDDLGGIDVNVPVTFDDYYYPIKGAENLSCGKSEEEIAALSATMSGFILEKEFQCRYEHLRFEKGVVPMDGETALKFVRSRHSDEHGGDFARSERQYSLLKSLLGKAISLNALTKWPELFDQFARLVKTDLNKDVIKLVVGEGLDLSEYKVFTLQLSTENVFKETKSQDGQYILVPKAGSGNWDEMHNFIKLQLERF